MTSSKPDNRDGAPPSSAAAPARVDDLGFDFRRAAPWFPHVKEAPYVLVRVSDEHANAWADALGLAVRRCYVSDALIETRAKELGVAKGEVIASKLPDPGATMAGDFGEILVYVYQAALHAGAAIGPKRWRLKQDRTKPAPLTDVVQFVLPSWPLSTEDDVLLCSEVKAKSTDGGSAPIRTAIQDCLKDRTSRLARTLEWLRERAIGESLGDITLPQIERFINNIDHPEATKVFRAVAVVCQSLVDDELAADAPAEPSPDYSVVVIAVPDLKKIYSAVFAAAATAVPRETEPGEESK